MSDKTNESLYKKYRANVEKYLQKDNRELNYQNRILIPLLEELLNDKENIDVVDVSTMYKNWNRREWHDRPEYAGDYTPDILISKNWTIYNKVFEGVEYLCLIEVKTPTADRRKHAKDEVDEYCQKVPHVILTDCLTWEFYSKDSNTGDVKEEMICLEKESSRQKVCMRGENRTIDWNLSEDAAGKTEFEKLCEKLKKFVVGGK